MSLNSKKIDHRVPLLQTVSPGLPCAHSPWPLPVAPLHGTYQSHITHWLNICHISCHNFLSDVSELCAKVLESKKKSEKIISLA